MKRMLAAAIISMLAHAFFLGSDFGWFEQKALLIPEPRIVSLSLTYRPAQKSRPEPSVKMPEPLPEVTPPPGQILQNVRRRPKATPPPKPLNPVPPPEKKEPSPIIPPIDAAQIPESRQVLFNQLNKNEIRTLSAATDTSSAPNQGVAEKNKTNKVLGQPVKTARVETVIRKAKPIYRNNPPPRYPLIARRRGLQGTVILDVYIDKSGRVDEIKVFKTSGHAMLDRAALTAVKNWSFRPGMRGNENLEMWVKVPIRFQLKSFLQDREN